jgi:hypothetical protein
MIMNLCCEYKIQDIRYKYILEDIKYKYILQDILNEYKIDFKFILIMSWLCHDCHDDRKSCVGKLLKPTTMTTMSLAVDLRTDLTEWALIGRQVTSSRVLAYALIVHLAAVCCGWRLCGLSSARPSAQRLMTRWVRRVSWGQARLADD